MPLSTPSTSRRAPVLVSRREFELTGEQNAVMAAVHERQNSPTVVEALAGTGKTSTLVEIACSFPRRPGIYLAFNKSVQLEAERKFPDWIDVRTAHSVAYQAVGRQYANRLPGNSGASRMSARQMASVMRVKALQLSDGAINAVVLTKMAQATVARFMKSADREIGMQHLPPKLVERFLYGHDYTDGAGSVMALSIAILPIAEKIWDDLTKVNGKFRFTPDVYLKLWQLTNPRLPVDYVMFDEAQDADPVTASVVAKQAAQLIYVGDRNQAIYGWRGAVDAMSEQAIPGATRLPLTKSFRFGPAIAEAANGWLELLGAQHRVVGHEPVGSRVGELTTAPRAILCRGNGTALGWVLSLLGNGVPVALAPGDKNAGKDIERFAWAAKDLMNGEGSDHPDLVGFTTWGELVKFVDEEEDTDDLKRMVGIITRVGVTKVIDAIRGLVPEEKATVTVSTAHKAKGLEWSSVKVADDFTPPEPNPETGVVEPDREGMMLNYVTVTRAKQQLDPGPLAEPRLWT